MAHFGKGLFLGFGQAMGRIENHEIMRPRIKNLTASLQLFNSEKGIFFASDFPDYG